MVGRRATKATSNSGPDLAVLKQDPNGRILLIRNIGTGGAVSIRSGMRGDTADPDVTIPRREEAVVSASWAKTSADLKKYLGKGVLDVSWVDENYEAKTLPKPDNAPADILLNLNRRDKMFALDQIALQRDQALAVAAVQTKVMQPEPRDRMMDARFMRERFYYILELAEWLEQQIDNRPKILAEIKKARTAIRDL
jgi:hypothetical protein